MKKTGILWCPEIPESWQLGRVKDCFNISKDISTVHNPTVLKLARSGITVKDVSTNEGQMAESYDNYNKVKTGDLLLNPMDLYSGANCNVSEVEGVISPAYTNLRAKIELIPKFFDYYFKVQYWTMAMFAHGKGVSFDNRWTINAESVKSYEIPFPSLLEQKRIVDELNQKCSEVDALIANEEKQIEKLKEYKQSLITEVVTKGLDPDAHMKDSGVEWIGDINANYTVNNIRSLFEIKKDIIGHEPDTVLSITQNGLKIKNINENSGQMANSYANYQIVRKGDFAMNHMDLLTGGIGISEYDGVTSPDYRVFQLRNSEMNPRYFLYIFESYYRNKIFYAFGQGAANLGRWRLPAKNFYSTYIPVAPIDEQNSIVEYLDGKCNRVDHLINIKQNKIVMLNKYKRSLIYEYVTGKKEVN